MKTSPSFEPDLLAQRVEVDRLVAGDVDAADAETRALVDRTGDEEPLLGRVDLGLADLDLEVAGVGVLLLDLPCRSRAKIGSE